MEGNAGMRKQMTMSPDFADEIDPPGVKKEGQYEDCVESNRDIANILECSLPEQLDIEILKLEKMITCLEEMERQLECRRQTTLGGNDKTNGIIHQVCLHFTFSFNILVISSLYFETIPILFINEPSGLPLLDENFDTLIK